MANLKVLDGNAVAKYLSTDGAGTDADPHVSHHILDANTDGVYIGDIKFGESLLAGTNAIGKLAANNGVDIGDVTINNAAGAAAINIQDGGNTITVDGTVATVTGVTTVSTLTTITNPVAIKNAAADTVTGVSGTYDTIDVSLTNGTYRATIDSSGYLTTNINGTITVAGSVTADTELPAAAALSDTTSNPTAPMVGAALMGWDATNGVWERLKTDDSNILRVTGAGTAGSADSAVVTIQGIASATPVIVTGDAAGSLTIDNAALAVVGGGAESTALRVTIANDSTGLVSVDDGGGTLTVDGSVTADTELPAAGTLGDAMNNPTTPLLGACLMGWDSAAGKWERCKTDASNYLKVDASVATVTVTGDAAGSLTVDQATHDSLQCNANIQQGDADVSSSNELYVRGSGTAGSADAAVLTVQGIGSMTPILATLQASDGTDIGNVDIASASFEKAEDAGHSTGDKGVMALAVRHDTISSLCGTDLDYTPLQVDATGYLYTKDKNAASLAVVGGGAEASALRVTIANNSTGLVSVDDGGGTLTVDGTVTATPSGVQEIEGDEAESSGNLPQPVLIGGDDGTDIKNINVDATTGDVQVDVTNQVDVGGATPVVTPVTGSASPFSTSYAPSADFWLESLTLHLSAAGTTSEAFTVTLNATDGAAYDTLLFSQDLSKGAVTDLVWVPEGGPMLFENGDTIDLAWANSQSRTYGLRVVARLA